MRIEYYAAIKEGEDITSLFEGFHRHIRNSRDFEVISADPERLHFRIRSAPKRTNWPEDVTLSISDDSLVVTFHSGSGAARDKVLDFLLQASGGAISEFSEF